MGEKVDGDEARLVLEPTDQYLETYPDIRIKNLLMRKHTLTLSKFGVLTIESEVEGPEGDQLAKRYYRSLWRQASAALKSLEYRMSFTESGSDENGSETPALVVVAEGDVATMDNLADSLEEELERFLTSAWKLTAQRVQDLIADVRFTEIMLRGFGTAFYDNLLRLLRLVNSYVFWLTTLIVSTDRIRSSQNSSKWALGHCTAQSYRDLLQELTRDIELVLKIYSDSVGTSGIYATIEGIGAGILLVAFTLPDPLAKWMAGIVGAAIMGIDTALWMRSRPNRLILDQLEALSANMK